MKATLLDLNYDTLEQGIERYDFDDETDDDLWPKYEKISTKQLEQGKWFYDLLSGKDGLLKDMPQNFIHNLKETYGNESDISKELDDITKKSDISILPWKVDLNSFVKQGDTLDEDASYYVLTFQGKKDGIEWKHSITISHMWDVDIYPDTEITHLEEAMIEKEIVSSTNEKLDGLRKEIQETIQARED